MVGEPKLTVVVPTVGRETLRRTLASIKGQRLIDGDEVIVVQDGVNKAGGLLWLNAVWFGANLPGRTALLHERSNDWGATPRTLGMCVARGDYVLFMDDDDVYLPGAFDAVRRACVGQRFPLLFRMRRTGTYTIWRDQAVYCGNVSTQMIVVPNDRANFGVWGKDYCGDFEFIKSTVDNFGGVVWRPEEICVWRP
jgi:glycosyltransferase involved in cell wall biosynthesis